MIDSHRIAELTAELMDELDREGIAGEIEDILIVVEIDDGEDSLTRVKCSSERGVIGMGLAHTAVRLYEGSISVDED